MKAAKEEVFVRVTFKRDSRTFDGRYQALNAPSNTNALKEYLPFFECQHVQISICTIYKTTASVKLQSHPIKFVSHIP